MADAGDTDWLEWDNSFIFQIYCRVSAASRQGVFDRVQDKSKDKEGSLRIFSCE